MRWSAGIIVCLIFVSTCLQAQHNRYGVVKGTILDSISNRPLESASVAIYLVSDSSLVNYALASRKGDFSIADVPVGINCKLVITHKGYQTMAQPILLAPEQKELVLDTIRLVKAYNELQEVIVSAPRPPVTVKQPDTLEFNVSAFKTMPNAVLEDLVKQLPGVDVDKDGNLTINGKKVTKITLDGREFFGGDPRIALKNLPKDIIDKLQVMDNKSREARFNKTTDGNEDLAINLTLRKEVQKGWFGKISAGYGTNDRYEDNAMINYFNGSKQLSFIGNANNTNRGTISGGDFNINTANSTLNGGGGLTRAASGGVNFSDNIGQQLKLNGSYFYNNTHSENLSRVQRKNILPDTTFYYNADNNNINDYINHRFTLNASYIIDTLNELHINSYVNTSTNNAVTGNKATSTGSAGQLINTSENNYTTDGTGKNITTEFFFSHRFKKVGRGITLGMNYNYNNQSTANNNTGENDFYKNNAVDSTDLVNQQGVTGSNNKVLNVTATYSEPITKYLSAVVRYNYSRNTSLSNKVTYKLDTTTGKYDLVDTAYTNAFNSVNESHTPDISLNFNKNKYRAAIGSGIQFLQQDNLSVTTGTLLHQRYMNITPTANIGYNFSKTGSISLFYNGRSQQPSIQQLQPVPDNSNPLYLQLGNPDLRPSFFHNVNMQVRESNGSTYWFAGFNFNTTQNQIISQTWYDSVGRQISQPINVNGNYGTSGNLQFSHTWKRRDVSLRMNVGGNVFYTHSNSFSNKIPITTDAYSLSQTLGLNFTYKQQLSIMPAFNIRYNKTHYTSADLQDAQFNTKTFSVSAFWNEPKWLIIENNLQYSYNSQIAPGFRKSVTMWSAALNCLMFKKQQGVLRLAVYDILKQNAGVYRTITPTYTEDRQTQVLQQYFLLSFIYNLRKFEGKK